MCTQGPNEDKLITKGALILLPMEVSMTIHCTTVAGV